MAFQRQYLILFYSVLIIGMSSCQTADLPTSKTGAGATLDGLRWQIPAGEDLGGNVNAATDPPVITTTMTGTVGKTYSVTLRFRGVVEQNTYDGGTRDGYFNAGGTPAGGAFNIYELNISNPAGTYYLNAGTAGIYNCFALDYQEEIQIATGATVSLIAQTVDDHQITNVDANGNPIVIPGIPPAPAAYNGQFIQMDVLSVK